MNNVKPGVGGGMQARDGELVQVHVPQMLLKRLDCPAIKDAIQNCGFEVEIVADRTPSGFLHHIAIIVLDFFLKAGEVEAGSLAARTVWEGMKPPIKALKRLGHKIMIVIHGEQDPPPTYVVPEDLPEHELDRALDNLPQDLIQGSKIVRTVTWRRWDPENGVWEMTDTTEIHR